MKKSISVFLLSVLVATSGIAGGVPLQCKTNNTDVEFSCGDGSGTQTMVDDFLLMTTCVAPDGYAFAGWKMDELGPVINFATIFNSQDKLNQEPPYVFGGIKYTANYIQNIDVDTFDVNESIVGAIYNPDINRVYYEFPSGGLTIKPICSSHSTGDGAIEVVLDGSSVSLPTASADFDLSQPGDNCWIEVESPHVSNGTRVNMMESCENCAYIAVELPLMGNYTPEYKEEFSVIMSRIIALMLGK